MTIYKYRKKMPVCIAIACCALIFCLVYFVFRINIVESMAVAGFVIIVELLYIIPQSKRADIKIREDGIIFGDEDNNKAVPWKTIEKVQHFKRGPITERVTIVANNSDLRFDNMKSTDRIEYQIDYDLINFRDFCKELYDKVNVERCDNSVDQVFDDWFLNKFQK